jgi:hypothetical protein
MYLDTSKPLDTNNPSQSAMNYEDVMESASQSPIVETELNSLPVII